MSYDTMSAIENEPSNTSDTTNATILSVSRRVELLRMSLRTLTALLEATGLHLDLTNRLSPRILENLDSELVIMATMDTGEWPREPPPVEERRTLTAVADTSVLASQDAFIASNLEPNQVRQGEVTTRFVLTAEDIALVKNERVRLASRLTNTTMVAGLVVEKQYIGSAFHRQGGSRAGVGGPAHRELAQGAALSWASAHPHQLPLAQGHSVRVG